MFVKYCVGAALLLVLAVVGVTLRGTPPQLGEAKPAWDYLIMGGGPDGQSLTPGDSLSKFGAEGWELVAVTEPTVHGACRFYFKRPK